LRAISLDFHHNLSHEYFALFNSASFLRKCVCPLKNLPCTSTADLLSENDYVVLDEIGVELNYIDPFLVPGSHNPEGEVSDPKAGNCDWVVKDDGSETPWPLLRADCTISLDQAKLNNQDGMVDAIQLFHVSSKKASMHALLCSYRMMGL
jgi:hypothetical protein